MIKGIPMVQGFLTDAKGTQRPHYRSRTWVISFIDVISPAIGAMFYSHGRIFIENPINQTLSFLYGAIL